MTSRKRAPVSGTLGAHGRGSRPSRGCPPRNGGIGFQGQRQGRRQADFRNARSGFPASRSSCRNLPQLLPVLPGRGPVPGHAAALVDGSRVGVVMGGEDIQRRQHLVTETEKFPEYGRPAAVPASRVEADGRLGIEGHLRRRDRFRAAYLLRARAGDGCGFVAADLPVPCAGYFIPGVARNLRRAVPAHVLGEVTARGVRARLARGDGRMRARGHVDVAERAEIRPQPAHKRQGCGLDLFDAAHAFLGVLPDGPRFRAEFVRGPKKSMDMN